MDGRWMAQKPGQDMVGMQNGIRLEYVGSCHGSAEQDCEDRCPRCTQRQLNKQKHHILRLILAEQPNVLFICAL